MSAPTYQSAGAKLLRSVLGAKPATGAVWTPERGWHDTAVSDESGAK